MKLFYRAFTLFIQRLYQTTFIFTWDNLLSRSFDAMTKTSVFLLRVQLTWLPDKRSADTHIMERQTHSCSHPLGHFLYQLTPVQCHGGWFLFSSGQWVRGSLHTGHVASPSQCTGAPTETCDVETHTHISGQFMILSHHAWFLTTGRN